MREKGQRGYNVGLGGKKGAGAASSNWRDEVPCPNAARPLGEKIFLGTGLNNAP